MSKRPSIVYQVKSRLMGMAAYGCSKHDDKLANGGKPRQDRIYSGQTMTTYMRCCAQFAVWVRKQYGCKWIADARVYVGVYLQRRMDRGLSGWTIRRDACALAKLYQCRSTEFGVKLPTRCRADVKRYADAESKAAEFEASYPELAQACKCCGLRVHELRLLRTDDVTVNEKGKCVVTVRKGKGGKRRYVIALDQTVQHCATGASRAGREFVFSAVPRDAPVHWYRHIFAQLLYDRLARPVHQIPKKDRYVCRAERKGCVYDKRAMRTVSKALGHKRLGVVTYYIR